jgi:SAM-dependent methyltransferase
MMQPEIGALINAASRPYVAAGYSAYCFVRAKLTFDPVFLALLRSGRLPDRARMLDLGCSHAALASLMLAARAQFESGLWPAAWPAPPSQLQLHGIDAEPRLARRANIALGHRAVIHAADLREAPLPQADVVVLIDVLHYLEEDAQISLLQRIAQSLRGGGLLILRIADSTAGWRFHFGQAADRCGSLLSPRAFARHCYRPLNEWLQLLDTLGFETNVDPPAAGQPFANVLIWAETAPRARA